MADEGLREIQLNGKQLVFLFMASTVVAVVIFLCGVMVGRGVRVLRASELATAVSGPAVDPTAPTESSTSATPAIVGSGGSSPTQAEDLTYYRRLEGQDPPDETFPDSPAPAPKAQALPVNSPAIAPQARRVPAKSEMAKPAVSKAPAEPPGNGFVVQVAAVPDRRQAETIAARLAGKGYPSFVTTPGAASPRMFRVRVGKYKERREAQSVATRLQKEEQFEPWITR